ncbi:MAG: thioredoxin family protein [Sedimentisphaerales bacterium]|jgi:thiol:disulfide interchange protein
MRIRITSILSLFLLMTACVVAAEVPQRQKINVVTFWAEQQFDVVSPAGKSAIAVHFELEKDWHFYASADNAPGGMNLKLEPNEQGTKLLSFGKPIFPKPGWIYDDALGKKIDVIGGDFTVYLPFIVSESAGEKTVVVDIGISGAVCSNTQCRVPDFGGVKVEVKIKLGESLQPKFTLPEPHKSSSSAGQLADYSVWAALILAFVAGLSLNIMPCVWPVLPIIVMRLVEQAKQGKSKSVTMGLAFCAGVLLFFACLAGTNIVLKLVYNTTLQWGDQFRNPAFVAGMAMLMVVLALFMFGLFTITVPASISGKSGSGKGFGGAIGMGFLAAILSTPCSFAILAAAFAWAQAQPLGLATLAIMVIGIGMAAPFAILTAMPALLSKTPRPGRWMELFKQTIGFVLLVIAVKLIAAIPADRRINVLYFAVVLGFCVWMWGGWVSYAAPASRRWLVRIIAVALVVAAGFAFLPAPKPSLIDWQKYDSAVIKQAQESNKPVLMDFTADWCLNCVVVDKKVYARKDIADLIKQKGVLAIRADTTVSDYPATVALKEIYNEPGVPVNILLVPGQDEPKRWRGLSFGDELKSALEQLKNQ